MRGAPIPGIRPFVERLVVFEKPFNIRFEAFFIQLACPVKRVGYGADYEPSLVLTYGLIFWPLWETGTDLPPMSRYCVVGNAPLIL